MNKTKLNKLYDQQLAVWKDKWSSFFDAVLEPLPELALDIIAEGDVTILQRYEPLTKAERKAFNKKLDDYRTTCLIKLGLEPQAWQDWFDNDNFSQKIDYDKPDLSKTPETIKPAPLCPDEAFQEALTWTYDMDWQGVIKAVLLVDLSIAKLSVKGSTTP